MFYPFLFYQNLRQILLLILFILKLISILTNSYFCFILPHILQLPLFSLLYVLAILSMAPLSIFSSQVNRGKRFSKCSDVCKLFRLKALEISVSF